jgi:hypothetical protein
MPMVGTVGGAAGLSAPSFPDRRFLGLRRATLFLPADDALSWMRHQCFRGDAMSFRRVYAAWGVALALLAGAVQVGAAPPAAAASGPVVSAVSPTSGPTAGRTRVTVRGMGAGRVSWHPCRGGGRPCRAGSGRMLSRLCVRGVVLVLGPAEVREFMGGCPRLWRSRRGVVLDALRRSVLAVAH